MIRKPAISALWIALLGASLTGTAMAGDPERGERMAATCEGCHGPGGRSTNPDMYPSLAGRDATALEHLVRAYRDGDVMDLFMSPQAEGLSDQDIRDLAAYFAAQEPED